MMLFLFLIFVCCAVKCDYVSNIYVIEMPQENVAKVNTPFKVYWNVPTKQCKSKKVNFDNLAKFGIIQNQNDSFEGEKITIMYDPGVFPAIFKGESGKYKYRNGGVPQEGNLEMHLTEFKENLSKSIPDPNFSGIGIIDFESWRPTFRQLFGSLEPYVTLSMNIERRRHFWWPTSWQKTEATKRFEDAARVFMQTTLSIAKQMRPKASWGYYAFPYCFNMGSNNMMENCSNKVKEENDRIYWLWSESTALLPSVYSSSNLTTSQLKALVRGRVTEANRVKKPGTLVLPYFWFRYRDAGFMREEDVIAVFEALYTTKASGIIIWGSSNDVNRVNKCEQLYDYVETVLGPIVYKYVQKINKVNDEQLMLDPPEENSENILTNNNNVITMTTLSENVSYSVEQEELMKVTTNDSLDIELSTTEKVESSSNIENTDAETETSTDDNANIMNNNSEDLIRVAISMRRPINTTKDSNYNNSWNITEMTADNSKNYTNNYINEDLLKLAIESNYFLNASLNVIDNDEQLFLDPPEENSENILTIINNLITMTTLSENVSYSVAQGELMNVATNDSLGIELSTTEKVESSSNIKNTNAETLTSTDDNANIMNNNSEDLIRVAISMRRPINTTMASNYNNSWNITEMPADNSKNYTNNYINEDLLKLAIESNYFLNASLNVINNDTVIFKTFKNISKDTKENLINNDKKDIVITLNVNIIYPEMVLVNLDDNEITLGDNENYSLDETTNLSTLVSDATISQDIEN